MAHYPQKSRRGSTAVFGVLLLVLITFVSGILFYTFVMQNISFATNTFSNQMAALLVNSFSINATHIVAFLQNTGSNLVEVTSAYVNGLITAIVNMVKIAPNAIGAVILAGSFIAENLYSIKLGTIFGTDVTFQASF
jgi:flagellin-like protein